MPFEHDAGAGWSRRCEGCRAHMARASLLESELERQEARWVERYNELVRRVRDAEAEAARVRLAAEPEPDNPEGKALVAALRAKVRDLQSALGKARRKAGYVDNSGAAQQCG